MKILYVLISLTILGCSSVPAPPEAIYTVRNKAADFTLYGNSHFRSGEYERALESFILALKENTRVNDEEGMIGNYNSIGKTYSAMGTYDRAETMYYLALNLASELNNDNLLLLTLSNRSELLLRQKKYSEAYDILSSVTADAGIKDTQALYYHSLGAALKGLERYEDAITVLNKAADINSELKKFDELGANYYVLASIYSKMNNIELALSFCFKALESDKKYENSYGIAADLKAIGDLYYRNQNWEKAYIYYKKAYVIHKNLDLEDRATSLLVLLNDLARDLELTQDLQLLIEGIYD